MRRGLLLVAVMLLVLPAVAEAASSLSIARAQQLARAEAQSRANQEPDGGGVEVGDCSRRSVRYVSCPVSWRYTEEFDGREVVDCSQRDPICSVEEERIWRDAQRQCTARVNVRYLSPRRARSIAVLTGQRCTPFFDRDGGVAGDPPAPSPPV